MEMTERWRLALIPFCPCLHLRSMSKLSDLFPFRHVINCYLDCPVIIYVVIIKDWLLHMDTSQSILTIPLSDTLAANHYNLQEPFPDAFNNTYWAVFLKYNTPVYSPASSKQSYEELCSCVHVHLKRERVAQGVVGAKGL